MKTRDVAAIIGGIVIGTAATSVSYLLGLHRGRLEGAWTNVALAFDPPMVPELPSWPAAFARAARERVGPSNVPLPGEGVAFVADHENDVWALLDDGHWRLVSDTKTATSDLRWHELWEAFGPLRSLDPFDQNAA